MLGSNIFQKITKEQDGLQVKQILSLELHFSRREITRLNSQRGILLNGESCRLTEVVHENDELEICLTGKDQAHGVRLMGKPTILYEDEYLVVVNKPAGMPAHASKEHPDDDMGTLLRNYYEDKIAPKPVGRLDKDVSGIMLYAKDRRSAALLSSQREEQLLHKEYLAVVKGHMKEAEGTLRYALKRNASGHNRKVEDGGQMCITDYHVEQEAGKVSLVRITIRTGRTHQIRAGMAHYGHPLLGDRLYGGENRKIRRVALHCADLQFLHPKTNELIKIHCELPEDMKVLLEDRK